MVDHITNQEMLRSMNWDRNLIITIKKRKTACLEHILRHSRYSLLKLVLEGKIEGQGGPGRRKSSAAADREEFAGIVVNLH